MGDFLEETKRGQALTAPDSPLTVHDILGSTEFQELMMPNVAPGGPAADFSLPRLDFSEGSAQRTGRMVRLSDYAGVQPVALIFGSYT
jgi:hypothetical protein